MREPKKRLAILLNTKNFSASERIALQGDIGKTVVVVCQHEYVGAESPRFERVGILGRTANGCWGEVGFHYDLLHN